MQLILVRFVNTTRVDPEVPQIAFYTRGMTKFQLLVARLACVSPSDDITECDLVACIKAPGMGQYGVGRSLIFGERLVLEFTRVVSIKQPNGNRHFSRSHPVTDDQRRRIDGSQFRPMTQQTTRSRTDLSELAVEVLIHEDQAEAVLVSWLVVTCSPHAAKPQPAS